MESFLCKLPKIELHAHLNGSLNIGSIRELGQALYGESTAEFLELGRKFIEFGSSADLSECFQKFTFMHELTATRKGLELATRLVIRDFLRDNVVYLELRTTPKCNSHMTRREYLECVLATIEESNRTYGDKILVKLLPSIDRGQDVGVAAEIVSLVLELSLQHPHTIVGVDLSGHPGKGHFRDFKQVLERVRQSGLKLTLHCAEIVNEPETREMLQFGMDRCGHGTFLNDQQLKHLAAQGTAIECCLTSNVKCATVPTYEKHHFKCAIDAGCSVVLCTDDSGVFDTTLTQEFLHAVLNFGLEKSDIYKLCLNAIQAAFASDAEKEFLRKQIDEYFTTNKQ